MREDYGNISLTVGEADYEMDDGFGGGVAMTAMEFAEEAPEMLREAAAAAAAAEVSLEPSLLREESGEEAAIHHMSNSLAREKFRLEAPIRDDGFGGLVHEELMAGGLFEGGGALFEEPATPAAAPSPLPEEEEDEYLPPASPMISDGESRPGTPMTAVSDGVAPPTLDQTPVISPPPLGRGQEEAAAAEAAHEQTTLLHNEVESFALAPVEASALGRAAGGDRRKRKRKLIVDEVKAISGEGMKAQLSDSADIVTTLDIAPPTKRLMHWKETGGVEELFSLPGRTLGARHIFKTYQKCLKQIPTGAAADERFETLHGDTDREELRLVQIGGAAERPAVPPPKEKATAPGKRKRGAEAAESAYAKRQQELIRRQEEFSLEEAVRRQQQQQQVDISLPREEATTAERQIMVSPLPPPPALDETGLEFGLTSPAAMPTTPAREPDFFAAGLPVTSPLPAVGPPAAELTFAQQVTLTEQWVSQVQPAALPDEEDLGGYEAPEYPEEDEEEEPCAGLEEEEAGAAFPDMVEAEGEPADESAMQEDETIEQYEDRVLNKRAAQMHRHLTQRFQADKEIELESLLRNNQRKQVAQKFYSILVLQKVMAVEASQSQEAPFGSIRIARGPKFESALQSL